MHLSRKSRIANDLPVIECVGDRQLTQTASAQGPGSQNTVCCRSNWVGSPGQSNSKKVSRFISPAGVLLNHWQPLPVAYCPGKLDAP
jgi:hypothetical protein